LQPQEIYQLIDIVSQIYALEDRRKRLHYSIMGGSVAKEVLSTIYQRIREWRKVSGSEVTIILIGEDLKMGGKELIDWLFQEFPHIMKAETG